MASAKKRPENPIVSTIIVRVPADVPRPTVATKKIAQIRSGIVLKNAIIPLEILYNFGIGLNSLAANIAKENPHNIPTKVPTNAICKVSRIDFNGKSLKNLGNISLRRRTIYGTPLSTQGDRPTCLLDQSKIIKLRCEILKFFVLSHLG